MDKNNIIVIVLAIASLILIGVSTMDKLPENTANNISLGVLVVSLCVCFGVYTLVDNKDNDKVTTTSKDSFESFGNHDEDDDESDNVLVENYMDMTQEVDNYAKRLQEAERQAWNKTLDPVLRTMKEDNKQKELEAEKKKKEAEKKKKEAEKKKKKVKDFSNNFSDNILQSDVFEGAVVEPIPPGFYSLAATNELESTPGLKESNNLGLLSSETSVATLAGTDQPVGSFLGAQTTSIKNASHDIRGDEPIPLLKDGSLSPWGNTSTLLRDLKSGSKKKL